MLRRKYGNSLRGGNRRRESYIRSENDVPLDIDGAMSASNQLRYTRAKANDAMDRRYGFEPFIGPGERVGWLVNMHPTDVLDDSKNLVSAVDFYFIQSDDRRFKVSRPYLPYFLVSVDGDQDVETEVTTFLSREFAGRIVKVEVVEKEDLDMPNHLIGLKARYLKLSFHCVDELVRVRKEVASHVKRNKEVQNDQSTYTDMLGEHFQDSSEGGSSSAQRKDRTMKDAYDYLTDIREYDVPYLMRVSIDLDIFVAHWYTVKCRPGQLPEFHRTEETVPWPEPVVLAYDIETTKLPLKFPDASVDQIMMISYMIDGTGFLVCNREIIAEDIEDFEFTPRPEFPGHFRVFNVANEEALIHHFFDHILRVKPTVMVTYNGDCFDWPFVEARAAVYNISMFEEIGFSRVKGGPSPGRDPNAGDYLARPAVHMDCFRWVKRDSYLPIGAHGLKAVAKAKLHYDPIEMDPEVMCLMAREDPRTLANYSVSDAVATYYLYMKYVHPFVFALCTILPVNPDDVLRKGSGTLCEALLMVRAYEAKVVFPHKQSTGASHDGILNQSGLTYSFTDDNKLIDSETYVGGHVEALEAGVFRADIPVRFRLIPAACERLREDARRCITYALSTELDANDPSLVESLVKKEDFEKICCEVEQALSQLSATPNRVECPSIVHLDVGAMYPNIILTNRLQPSAVTADPDKHCSGCHFYKPGAACRRFMSWQWRGELWTASRADVYRIQAQLQQERFSMKGEGAPVPFHQLSKEEQVAVEKKRLSDFCRRAYKRIHTTRTEERVAMVCQRENSFYVDTVRAFRDRRYKFKGMTKVWKRKLDDAMAATKAGVGDPTEVKQASALVVLYDSLQLAHKCILNSFYGYVMRKGARWHSIEMAGVVCNTGANIITRARELIEQIGRSLELDTDGIWCILPASFPQNLTFRLASGKRLSISYPGAVLNQMVRDLFTNHQYHEPISGANLSYQVRSENTIAFEIDGPYRAMVLPAAREEGKRLKKRYAVFNFDGTLAELKGFEVKRNGELQLIKIFQSSVFEAFLHGSSLTEVYAAVAKVADHWLDVLHAHGAGIPDSELFDLIAENRSMSRRLEDYGSQKSTSISTAKRLAEFLGDAVVKEAGLSCRFIIAKQPEQAPVTERAIPLAIFQADPSVKRHFLRKWLKDPSISANVDLRAILDWDYYLERLGGAIQKIITIPAALQQVANPVPRVAHPDWLHKRLHEKTDTCRQLKLTDLFPTSISTNTVIGVVDIEDTPTGASEASTAMLTPRVTKKRPLMAVQAPPGPPKHWREVLGDPPKLEEVGARAWLEFHQQKWRLQAERRKWLKESGVRGGGAPLAKRVRDLGGFLTRTRAALSQCVWQIIEIVPSSNQPGLYTLWVYVHSPLDTFSSGPQLHSIPLHLSRHFYVNQRVAKAQESGTFYRKVSSTTVGGSSEGSSAVTLLSNYTLPRSHPVYHLYEYTVPEDVYTSHAADIAADLARPEVEGVYELRVPPLFRLLAKLGCLCAVARRKPQQQQQTTMMGDGGVDKSFRLEQLEFRSLEQHTYLEGGEGGCRLRKMFLFFYHDVGQLMPRREALRQMYFLVIPWTQRAYVCVVDTARINKLPNNLDRLYSRSFEKHFSSTTTNLPSSLTFETRIETDPPTARRIVQRWITSANQERGQGLPSRQKEFEGEEGKENTSTGDSAPIIVLLHAPSSSYTSTSSVDAPWPLGEAMVNRRRVPQLTSLTEMPVVPLGGTGDDERVSGEGPDDAYSVLNWQNTVVKRAIKFYLQSETRFENQLELARYLHIPVGNVPVAEAPVRVQASGNGAPAVSTTEFGCDLFFARHLWKSNQILWASGSAQPDFGGKEVYDQRLLLEMEEANVVEINRPGCYRYVCVDLELSNLAVNTMLVASRIPELEGASVLTFDRLLPAQQSIEEQLRRGVNVGAQITNYDEAAACSAAFRVLRTMVVSLVKDVTQFKNPLADEQIIYFYHWLRSSTSLLYDPALRRTLQKLMKKVFLKLVDELNQTHGLDVVCANFSRLILCTHQLDVVDALPRADGLSRMLQAKPFFSHLDLQYTRGWHQLLWYDPANYAGLKIDLEATALCDSSQVTGASLDPKSNKEVEVDMWWHMARYLPKSRGIRSKFHTLIAGYLLATHRTVRNEFDRLTQAAVTSPDDVLVDATLTPGVFDFLDRLVREQIGPELYSFVQRLRRKGGPWCPSSDIGSGFSSSDIAAYLDEVGVETEMETEELVPPLLPPHPAELEGRRERVRLTPICDFVKTLSQVLSLDTCIARQVGEMQNDLFRLLGVGEFSAEAAWHAPHEFGGGDGEEVGTRSLLVHLPEVTCAACNFIRDLDICRESCVAWLPDSSGGMEWAPVCPHCRTPYSRSAIETSLLAQLEHFARQFILQDLQCPKCISGGGIQESSIARGGSHGRCADCATPLELTFRGGRAFISRRLAVYSAIGRSFNLPSLKLTADWLLEGGGN
ncbi:dna polymerase epsilon catalytic subunit a [Echinococcus multilocularis]|uniref:DNA polymerase epsilon catalytic subunit n=1 Tax=Echinococcus multilocularis TaxID=6211 RepID=A0A068Y6C1_ECHMU|nr:dna polymerase epsilon catalytic subunit a [Echinococcus multilocularis]